MSFDSIPEDSYQSFPCECGGNIVMNDEEWVCDSCDAVMGVDCGRGD